MSIMTSLSAIPVSLSFSGADTLHVAKGRS
jgi:hypothetical protein